MTQCPSTTNRPEVDHAPPGKVWVTNASNDDRSENYVLEDVSQDSATGELSGELTGAEDRVPPKAKAYKPMFDDRPEDRSNS